MTNNSTARLYFRGLDLRMKLQFPLWRLFASLTCFAIAFGLGRAAFVMPTTSANGIFLSILSAILCVVFIAAAIGVLFRHGLSAASITLQIIGSFLP
jgi:hypothetical protein